jgi:hypothetical protein
MPRMSKIELFTAIRRDAGPAAQHELDLVLRARDITGGPGWLIDMLALTRQRLETSTAPPAAHENAVETRGD